MSLPNTGTSTVKTPEFQLVQGLRRTVVDNYGIGAISGDPGTGKTFAAQALRTTLRNNGVRTYWVDVSRGSKSNDMPRQLIKELHPNGSSEGTYFELSQRIDEELHDSGAVVFLDDAQYLSVGLDKARHLHQLGEYTWSMILVGDFELFDKLQSTGHLSTRVDAWVEFQPMTGRRLLTQVRKLHPIFDASTDKALMHADDVQCGGRMREWARLARTLTMAGHAKLTIEGFDVLSSLSMPRPRTREATRPKKDSAATVAARRRRQGAAEPFVTGGAQPQDQSA